MRCPLERCRATLLEKLDALGRVRWICPQCDRRRKGLCQHCPRPVAGTVGRAYYCGPCKVVAKRKYVKRWQRNHNTHIAKKARERRWKAKGLKAPAQPMSYAERGKIGGKLGAAARVKALGPERVREIARNALAIRWAKYRERQALARGENAV